MKKTFAIAGMIGAFGAGMFVAGIIAMKVGVK